jgi:DNA-directed RNA polymerase subunit RPC12/RpoP
MPDTKIMICPYPNCGAQVIYFLTSADQKRKVGEVKGPHCSGNILVTIKSDETDQVQINGPFVICLG